MRGKNYLVSICVFTLLAVPCFIFHGGSPIILGLGVVFCLIAGYLLLTLSTILYVDRHGLEQIDETMRRQGYHLVSGAVITAWPPAISWKRDKITFRIVLPEQKNIEQFTSSQSLYGEINIRFVSFNYYDLTVIYDTFAEKLLLYSNR